MSTHVASNESIRSITRLRAVDKSITIEVVTDSLETALSDLGELRLTVECLEE